MKIKVGDQVVFNDLADAQVFDVVEVDGVSIGVTYDLGGDKGRARTQYTDKSLCRKSTKTQLANIQAKVSHEHNRT